MNEPDTLSIPAFQRKRSISARARKKPSYLTKKPTTTRKRTTTRRTTTQTRATRQPTIEELSDIPTTTVYPSDNLFDEPLLDEPPKKSFRQMKTCGTCSGYFDGIDVAVIDLSSVLRLGDQIIFETPDGLFEQTVESMQIDRKDIKIAHSGDDIGMKVLAKPTVGGTVYKEI